MRRTAAVWALCIVASACSADSAPSSAPTTASTAVPTSTTTTTVAGGESPPHAHGFSFSPRDGSGDAFVEFFTTAAAGATLVTWAGDWMELTRPDNAADAIRAAAFDLTGLQTMIAVGPFSDGRPLRPLDAVTTAAYRESAVQYAVQHRPAYLTLGVEVDVAADRHPDEFAAFVDLFAATAREIHAAAPGTQVLVVFQLERLSGRKDGLFGEEVVPPRWDLIDLFPDADVIGFTTYPGLIFQDPADIPPDYYSRLRSIVGDRPIAFIEVGWARSGIGFEGWESDAEEQARYVEFFLREAAALDAEPVIWSFLYDVTDVAPFDSMGILDESGTSPAWEAWLEGIAAFGG